MHYQPVANARRRVGLEKVLFQIKLLMWKRHCENTKSKWDLLKVVLPALLFFALLILIYSVFSFFPAGFIEVFFVPFAFWIYIQRLVVQITYEKSSKLQESMRMMGLSDFAYWTSYFIYDGLLLGFVLAFLCSMMTIGGILFNGANFGVILGFLFLFCLAATTFCFAVTAFFDNPQTSSQATLAILIGFYVIFITIFVAEQYTISLHTAQVISCFFPPLALQMGCFTFSILYVGISLGDICGILVADVFIYSLIAWYFAQVWPSKVGVRKPFYFVLLPSYWMPSCFGRPSQQDHSRVAVSQEDPEAAIEMTTAIPVEKVNEELLGAPTVAVHKMRKSFGDFVALNDLSFNMYENQIFALLGHNGAGKTTAISVLTGLIAPDYSNDSSAYIYNHSIHSEMEHIRYSLGVCPQHDVLFEGLNVREHILFFAQLKGYSYADADQEVTRLMEFFRMESRLDHLGNELSGGQKRMLSVAIAICGGSKFVVFDEPTAGMDPLARRELWDLLASLRRGRTMLLTTHYMDEADVLGDRVGIMAQGQMQCLGSTQFLKSQYGAGYKLVIEKRPSLSAEQLETLIALVHAHIDESKHLVQDGDKQHEYFNLPFNSVGCFGKFFTELEARQDSLNIENFGLNITTLEDVFLKVGEDHTVTPHGKSVLGIGATREYRFSFYNQVLGLVNRKLTYAMHDFVTIPLLALPIAAIVAAAVIDNRDILSSDKAVSDMAIIGIYLGGYLGVPGMIAEFIVRERSDKLRNVLTVMGCDFSAYWLGTFIADFIILLVPTVIMWITWGAAGMPHFYGSDAGLCFFLTLLFNVFLISFSYICSFMFSSPKSCISFMPILVILLIVLPNVATLIGIQIAYAAGTELSDALQAGILLWGTMMLSPHGAMFCVMLNVVNDYKDDISELPPLGACLAFMFAETALFCYGCYFIDIESVAKTERREDPNFSPEVLEGLDDDVLAERERVLNGEYKKEEMPLFIDRLRKVFPPKTAGRKAVVAVEDMALGVSKGEIFGLLGANGAGKTSALSMLTRLLVPTAGEAFVASHSILNDFSKGATHMGVVAQNNALWSRLSVQDHLFLFARLRGVPEDLIKDIVGATIDQLELTPHRKKLAMDLSGGMKRKLCVAIALIGDPEVVLLDEPSAGLDPVSRRNLWSVILRTMSHRAVILTTHSMDEAEALCGRMGIMVNGQVRILGSKQRLKSKFGSGFELSVKLQVHGVLETQVEALIAFVKTLFPSTTVLAENGGQVTLEVPKEEMNIGKVFTELENHKKDLSIEDYMVAQPTLEQVFIRTVHKYDPAAKSMTGMSLAVVPVDPHNAADMVVAEVNKCGCTDFFMRIYSAVNCGLFIMFWCVAIFAMGDSDRVGGTILFLLGWVTLIAAVVGLILLCCACCKPPKGADE